MGPEFNDYYDGWGLDNLVPQAAGNAGSFAPKHNQTKEKDFFFYDVPPNLIELVAPRLEGYPEIKFSHQAMNS